jgi:hypothetical protein
MGSNSKGYILHTDAVPRTACERYKVSVHVWIVVTEPALGSVFERFRIGGRVVVHVVRAHSDRSILWNCVLFILESDIGGAPRQSSQGTRAYPVANISINSRNGPFQLAEVLL